MKIAQGAEKIELKNVLVGEVWICGGQSNMQVGLRGVRNADEEIKAANFPEIRFYSVAQRAAYHHVSVPEGMWEVVSPETADRLSAVAYYFARKVQHEIHVPIGLVVAAVGGTPAEAWMSPEVLTSRPEFQPILEEDIAFLVDRADVAELKAIVARDCSNLIFEAASLIIECLRNGGKLLFFGNGGSAADAQHLAAEFVGRFVSERAALAAISLTTDSSILTAVGNDYGFDRVFARQVQALGRRGDVAVAISTSGNSPNVLEAVKEAKKHGLNVIGLSGKDGGALAREAQVAITVDSVSTARIQECHIAIGHIFCELVERELIEAKSL
jgi:D-sedoheptulose 7-phosphate isomerase